MSVWIYEKLSIRYATTANKIVFNRENLYSENSFERIIVISLSEIRMNRNMNII